MEQNPLVPKEFKDRIYDEDILFHPEKEISYDSKINDDKNVEYFNCDYSACENEYILLRESYRFILKRWIHHNENKSIVALMMIRVDW